MSNHNDKLQEKYYELLTKGLQYSTEQFDKAVLYVASGALALSITFIDKLVPLASASAKTYLVSSWILEVITIVLFTINHYIAIKAYNTDLNNYIQDTDVSNKYTAFVKGINFWTIISLGLGLISLIIFIQKNI